MKKIPDLFLWSGGVVGLLVMWFLRFIGKNFGILPLVFAMAGFSFLLVVGTIKIAIPAMREKNDKSEGPR